MFDVLSKTETWNVAADLNHIVSPFSLEDRLHHPRPASWDRIGGIVLLAFSILFIIPACFYLYWATRKIDYINQLKPVHVSTQQASSFLVAPIKQDHTIQPVFQKPVHVSTQQASNYSVAPIKQDHTIQPVLKFYSSPSSLNCIDETSVLLFQFDDMELKSALIKRINEGLKGKKNVFQDVKLLIYHPIGRKGIKDEKAMLAKISEENITHIVLLQKEYDTLHIKKIGDINVYSLIFSTKLNDDLEKKYHFSGLDFDRLLKDMA